MVTVAKIIADALNVPTRNDKALFGAVRALGLTISKSGRANIASLAPTFPVKGQRQSHTTLTTGKTHGAQQKRWRGTLVRLAARSRPGCALIVFRCSLGFR